MRKKEKQKFSGMCFSDIVVVFYFVFSKVNQSLHYIVSGLLVHNVIFPLNSVSAHGLRDVFIIEFYHS
jgi:hypothetical protein